MNVLILTDLSRVAQNAGEYALKFLENIPVDFYLLNIGMTAGGSKEGQSGLRSGEVMERLENRIGVLRKATANPAHRFFALYSTEDLVSATRRIINEKGINLIVMGAVRIDFSEDTLLGIHTYEVIKKIKCNVLAVPDTVEYGEPEKVVIPIDFSASLNNRIFQVLNQPGLIENARFTVLEIQKEPVMSLAGVEGEEMLFTGFQKNKLNFETVHDAEIISAELLLGMQEKFDMIVLLGKNLSICDRFLHTEHGLQASINNKLPILVLHQ